MMLQAVAHDVKNKLAELAMRLMDSDIEAAALALDAADKLSQALLLDSPEQIAPQIDTTSPVDLLDELAAVHRQLFADKVIHLHLDSAPSVWYYDVALIRLALSNAIHNALKHCQNAVTLSAYESDGYLVFDIRDDGPGFPTEILEAGEATATLPGLAIMGHSTGMGLRLSRKIVQAHKLSKGGVERSGWIALINENGGLARLAIP